MTQLKKCSRSGGAVGGGGGGGEDGGDSSAALYEKPEVHVGTGLDARLPIHCHSKA